MPPHPALMANPARRRTWASTLPLTPISSRSAGGERGKNGDGQDGGLGGGLRGSLGRGLEHSGAARGMDGEERDSERGGAADGSGYGVRDVVEFEVEEDLFTAGDQVANQRRAVGGEELFAYFIEADGFAKLRRPAHELSRRWGRRAPRSDCLCHSA